MLASVQALTIFWHVLATSSCLWGDTTQLWWHTTNLLADHQAEKGAAAFWKHHLFFVDTGQKFFVVHLLLGGAHSHVATAN